MNSAALALVLALGHFVFAQVLAVAFVEGALGVLFGPAETIAVRRTVPPERIREAVALNQSRSMVPGLVGPPLGGGLLAASRSLPFVADAASYLCSLLAVLSLRTSLEDVAPPALPRRHLVAEMVDGLRWIWRRRFLRALLIWFTGAGVLFNSIGLVTLVLAQDRGASSAELGVMVAITAGGGVIGALAAPRVLRMLSPRRLILSFAALASGATLLLLVARSPYVIGLLGATAFLLAPSLNALAMSLVLEEAPAHLQGRATSASIQIGSLAAPVGPVAAGLLIAAFGASAAALVYGLAFLALGVVAAAAGTFNRGAAAARSAPRDARGCTPS